MADIELKTSLSKNDLDSSSTQSTQSSQGTINQQEDAQTMNQEKPNAILKRYKFDGLQRQQIWGYSLGHFYNDLCAAVWFNYLLFYIDDIRNFPEVAPYAILSGQVFDGIATPFIGYLSDKTKTSIGQRTPWYLFGTILVTLTYLPIFIYQIIPEDSPQWSIYLFFTAFPSLFNVGWAAVQISNLSLVPSLSSSIQRRDILNSRRNTFTFVANLSVLSCAALFFQLYDDAKQSFEALAIVLVSVGLCATTLFMLTVKEVDLVKISKECQKNILEVIKKLKSQNLDEEQKPVNESQQKLEPLDVNITTEGNESKDNIKEINLNTVVNHTTEENLKTTESIETENRERGISTAQYLSSEVRVSNVSQIRQKGSWKQWFKRPMFYICGCIYMFVRLYSNVIASILPFYLKYTCEFADIEKSDGEGEDDITKLPFNFALVPMLLYLFSTGASSFVEKMFSKIGRRRTYFIGSIFVSVSSVSFLFIQKNHSWLIYPTACITGVAQAFCLNTAITLISDVIGSKGSEGAFVFGFYSLLDKFLTGLVLFVLIDIYGDSIQDTSKYAMGVIPGVAIIIAGICMMFIQSDGNKFKQNQQEGEQLNATQQEIKKLERELAM